MSCWHPINWQPALLVSWKNIKIWFFTVLSTHSTKPLCLLFLYTQQPFKNPKTPFQHKSDSLVITVKQWRPPHRALAVTEKSRQSSASQNEVLCPYNVSLWCLTTSIWHCKQNSRLTPQTVRSWCGCHEHAVLSSSQAWDGQTALEHCCDFCLPWWGALNSTLSLWLFFTQ